MPKYLIFHNISKALTLKNAARKDGRRVQTSDLSIVQNAVIAVQKGRVAWIGKETALPKEISKNAKWISLGNQTVLPAFTECHTHTIFGGHRAHEFELRNEGLTYLEIAKRGGGIQSTVRDTRRASSEELRAKAQKNVNAFVRQGVTTLEIKSGYGLSLKHETKILQTASELNGPRIVRTYLGPHALPKGIERTLFQKRILEVDLPYISNNGLADRADIFIEGGFFDLEFGRRYLTRAKELGLAITVHADQLSRTGASILGVQMGAVSVDHVIEADKSDIEGMAASKTTCVLLPASDFYLGLKYPKARELIDRGARVALSTDFNPGSSPTTDLQFVGVLARKEMKMRLPEVITAFTVGAASALGLQNELGSLEVGKFADFITIECDWKELFFQTGARPVTSTWREGRQIRV